MHIEEIKIGVLALQGGFQAHLNTLQKLSITCGPVRYPNELSQYHGLILPGGESTAQAIIGEKFDWKNSILKSKIPLFGTCAGLITLAKWGVLNIEILRNGFGSQIHSNEREVFGVAPFPEKLSGLFIRAPRITKILSKEVRILAKLSCGEPVCVQQDIYFGATFHPELLLRTEMHAYFCERVAQLIKMPKRDLLPL